MSSGSHPWTSQTLATGLLPFLPGWALRRVWPGRSGAAEVARATFTFAFDGTHSPPKAAGANLQLLCRLLDLGVSSLAPSSASASLQLPAPGAHRGGGRALPSRASSSRVHRALHDGLACSAARSNHRSLGWRSLEADERIRHQCFPPPWGGMPTGALRTRLKKPLTLSSREHPSSRETQTTL